MSDEQTNEDLTIVVGSTRFEEFEVPQRSIIEFPSGLIGFPKEKKYVVVEHKPPFSWLHSIDNPGLAFVIVDGLEFGDSYQVKPPLGDKEIDLKEEDEFAMLVIVTVRPDPTMTTANLKAPVFVNLRNRLGLQLILDDQRYSTRFSLWQERQKQAQQKKSESED